VCTHLAGRCDWGAVVDIGVARLYQLLAGLGDEFEHWGHGLAGRGTRLAGFDQRLAGFDQRLARVDQRLARIWVDHARPGRCTRDSTVTTRGPNVTAVLPDRPTQATQENAVGGHDVTASPDGPLRLAIAGCGQVFERFHLPAIACVPDVALVGACEPVTERRAWASERLQGLPVVATLDELLATVPADALLILAPPVAHRDLAVRAAAAGLHILVEKPMALSAPDAAAMLDAAARAGRHLQIGFTRRFREPYQRLRGALVQVGADAVSSVRSELAVPAVRWGAHGDFSGRDALGGGVLDDVLSHQVDLLGWLLGVWPVEARMVDGSDERGRVRGRGRVRCELRFPGGTHATCAASHGPYVERLEVELAHDRVLAASGTSFRDGSRDLIPGWRARRAALGDQIALAAGRLLRRPGVTAESFVRQLRDFVDTVRGTHPSSGADGHAGARTIATIEACRRAGASGRWERVAR
jgi:predicted dehydrogenase